MENTGNRVYLGLGCNLGDRVGNLREALKMLNSCGIVEQVSRIYESEAWGYEDDNAYLNLVCSMLTMLDPVLLHNKTLEIERSLGRISKRRGDGEPYEARLMDIDILFFNDAIIDQQDLIIPHPKLHLRKFVLQPMTDIAAGIVHPTLGRNISQLLEVTPDKSSISEVI